MKQRTISYGYYLRDLLDREEASALLDLLCSSFDITNRSITMSDGTTHDAGFGSFMFADANLLSTVALPDVWGARAVWPDTLRGVRGRIATTTGVHFHVARCIYYADGRDWVDFHRDLPAYGDTDEIASLSLGAERDFQIRSCAHPEDLITLPLASGSLLFMGPGFQDTYEHSLPIDPTCDRPRVNLTFRKHAHGVTP